MCSLSVPEAEPVLNVDAGISVVTFVWFVLG